MKYILACVIFLLLNGSFALAQSPVITQPYRVNSSNNSGTISVTNTFQSIWAKNTSTRGRAGCVIQNNGSNTMWVYFGDIANATKATSVVLAAGQNVSCISGGIVLEDQVSITGTSGDTFFAAQQ